MARRFTVIPQDTFDGLQLDAGVLLKTFNPASPSFDDEDIICATTGGIQASCVPTFSDLGDDVDNCPVNMMEFKHLDSWECKFSFTSLGTTAEAIRLALGAADITSNNTKITPRKDLELTDFSDVWWVGDKANGGLVAIQLKNALATSGFTLQTTKNGKGTTSVELTGHVSIDAQEDMPMVFYSIDDASTGYNVRQNLTKITSSYTGTTIAADASFTATLTAASGYVIDDDSVVVKMGGVDITAMAYDDSTSTISIAAATGNINITAVANASQG